MGKYVRVSYDRLCAYCGKDYTAHNIRSQYCSKKCRDIAIRIRNGVKCNTNTEPYHKTCAVCGNPFDTFRDAAVTCSSKCAKIYKQPKSSGKHVIATETWVNDAQNKFEYVSHDRSRIKLKCKCCGNVLERAKSTVRRCNVKCEYCNEEEKLQEARQNMVRFLIALKEAETPKKCTNCGRVFFSTHPTQKYCTTDCKKKRKRRMSSSSYGRRCRYYGVYYDSSVTRIKVIKKDNNTCQICGKICNPNDLRWGTFGPDFPTLDHIVPLAKGGTHTWGNVQCACGICNSTKRDLMEYEQDEKCS